MVAPVGSRCSVPGVQRTLSIPSQLLQLTVAPSVLHYMRPVEPVRGIWMCKICLYKAFFYLPSHSTHRTDCLLYYGAGMLPLYLKFFVSDIHMLRMRGYYTQNPKRSKVCSLFDPIHTTESLKINSN